MVENRDLKATPGIPDENRVVGEIPMKKAEYYGYFDPEPSTKEIIHQIEIAVNDSATKKKAKGKSNCPPPHSLAFKIKIRIGSDTKLSQS